MFRSYHPLGSSAQIVQGLLVALQPLLLPEANLIEEGSAAKAAAASHPQAPLGASPNPNPGPNPDPNPDPDPDPDPNSNPDPSPIPNPGPDPERDPHPDPRQAPLGADARALTTQRVACLVAALEAAPEKLQQVT